MFVRYLVRGRKHGVSVMPRPRGFEKARGVLRCEFACVVAGIAMQNAAARKCVRGDGVMQCSHALENRFEFRFGEWLVHEIFFFRVLLMRTHILSSNICR